MGKKHAQQWRNYVFLLWSDEYCALLANLEVADDGAAGGRPGATAAVP